NTGEILHILSFSSDSVGEITVTQEPRAKSFTPGESVTITCTTSSYVGNNLNWYMIKDKQAPKLLIYDASIRFSHVTSRFSGTGSDPVYTFTISDLRDDDAGYYYCNQDFQYPFTQ
ncbi:KVD15 protein, partial [Polypterus senegalus]